jgi:hypothetical protein
MIRKYLFTVLAVAGLIAPATLPAQQTVRTTGGVTAVALSSGLVEALQSLGVRLTPVAPGAFYERNSQSFAVFPVATGVLDLATAKSNFTHLGGLELQAGGTRLFVTDFEIDTSNPSAAVLKANATAQGAYLGKIPLFDLKLPSVSLPLSPVFGGIFVPQVAVTLDPAAAAALNQIFGVSAFAGGFSVGTATVFTFARGL